MRHFFLLLVVVVFFSEVPGIRAQVTLVQDDFESYTVGQHLFTQAPSIWTTWNNGPGTAEDPIVSDSLAFGGTKSIVIRHTNDALLLFQNKTSGRYRVSFFIRIPPWKSGYFSLLRNFDGMASEWGLTCYFADQGKGTIEAGDPNVTKGFNFSYNRWFNVTNIIDLDNDHVEIYVDSTLVTEFPWTISAPGKTGVRALDALNLFAWTGAQNIAGAWFDNIRFDELAPLPAPRNLQASVSHDTVSLTWQTPDTTGQTGYRIYRDSAILVNLVTGLTYLDKAVYPGQHIYSVKAVYPSGMSPEAGPVTALVNGGTSRECVLVEIATGTWCTYCPGAALGADDLVNNGKQVAIIEYHDGDPYENPASLSRNSYYSVPGYPTTQFDGGLTHAGGHATTSIYPIYLPRYEERNEKLSLFDMAIQVEKNGALQMQATITTSRIYPNNHNDVKLRVALTESHIPQHWQGFMEELNFVCREMYPDASGTTLDFSSAGSFTKEFAIQMDSSWNVSNCELIAFLQEVSSKEVLQCARVRLGSLGTGREHVPAGITFYPNPVTDILVVKSESLITNIELYDLSGRLLRAITCNQKNLQLDLSNVEDGLYIAGIRQNKNWTMKKILVRH